MSTWSWHSEYNMNKQTNYDNCRHFPHIYHYRGSVCCIRLNVQWFHVSVDSSGLRPDSRKLNWNCLLYFQILLLPRTLCPVQTNTSHWVSLEKRPPHYKPVKDREDVVTVIFFKNWYPKLSLKSCRLNLFSFLPFDERDI